MKKVLLVRPEYTLTTQDVSKRFPFLHKKAFMAPLDLATVAALTPDDVEVDLWDEGLRGRIEDAPDFKKHYDLVGVTGYGSHLTRARRLAQLFRERGNVVAVGGPGVSAAPERYRDVFDILFVGEAEYTWPQFVKEWQSGSYRHEYRQVSKVDMAHSPVPRWDNVAADLQHYLTGPVQTTRGCPFDCTFCDVIYIYGRLQRHKSIEQVLQEVVNLEHLGVTSIFLCDDNFYGNPKYYKELLRELMPLNNSFKQPLILTTQIDIRVAKDDEMLELLADSNFGSLLIGIESPNVDSLVEMNARKNLKANLVEDVKKIQSYGIEVTGSMIVGFDHDDTTIFQRTFDFVQQANIPVPQLTPLQAMVGTKLWTQLLKAGRVIDTSGKDVTPFTNINPKSMTRAELLSGWSSLIERTRDWRNFEARVKGMISGVKRRPRVSESLRRFSLKQKLEGIAFLLFSMDRQARGTAVRLMLQTRRQAPFMMARALKMVLQNFMWKAQQQAWRKAVDEEISRVTDEGKEVPLLKAGLFVPEGFRKPYKDVFPELHARVYRRLRDKSRVDGVLIEVIYDFLTRWGPTFEQFEEYHGAFLHEISDRSIASANGDLERPSASTAAEHVTENPEIVEVPDARRNRLADEVLRAVEQELRSFSASAEHRPSDQRSDYIPVSNLRAPRAS